MPLVLDSSPMPFLGNSAGTWTAGCAPRVGMPIARDNLTSYQQSGSSVGTSGRGHE